MLSYFGGELEDLDKATTLFNTIHTLLESEPSDERLVKMQEAIAAFRMK
jgi:hypothetical protein